ncbi:hypothetical protein COU00_04420 [Candidatus Falkowbacteria bacterium CG10_big_fil_rev_8_21_14_0_10_43_11]|uniref:Dipeptidylpeptidase IV N-terminal domain-containing protein n=1 Tax=Candidatus Falkowbacteria bacterium CG10_big_fil_rev_8_21_14_0_10_43_11 TaxID=1974568 RepID=A0A2M6WKY2_9BACT|nr:MAG: hypothetical protein COU00_04420 [Candidatus Falkowbacteria bacterium CG10_big_fil_rev_8_21_14_0_10_43_11]
MEINYKKISLAVGFLVFCVLIGYFIFWLFFKPAGSLLPSVSPAATTPGGQLPAAKTGTGAVGETGIGAGGKLPGAETTAQTAETVSAPAAPDATARGGVTAVTAVNQTDSLAPTLGNNGRDVYYYSRDDGKFYRLNQNGQTVALSDKTFFDVQSVTWAPNKDKAVLEYPDGANILYDFTAQRQFTLPKHWQEFDFSPQSNQIVAKSIGLDPENNWLIVSNEDGSQARALENLGNNADKIHSSWSPNNLSVALFTESLDFNRQTLYFVGQNKENFKSTVIEGRGLESQWAPSGDRLLYSVYSDDTNLNPSLWIVDAKSENIGANRQQLNLQTWANKCNIVSDQTAYCAVPQSLPEGAGLFPELANETADSIYKINLANGSRSLLAVPDGNFNVQNIVVSSNESELYFTDGATGGMYKMRLK